jgi:hypothetical protein
MRALSPRAWWCAAGPSAGIVALMIASRALGRLRLPLVGALVAAALVLVACGGSGEDKGISRADYVKKINGICDSVARQSADTNRALQALVDGSGTYTSRLKKAVPLIRETLRYQTSKVERFERVEPPKKDVAKVKEITTTARAFLKELRDIIPKAREGDLPSFIDFATDASGNRGKVERLGVDYGIKDACFTLPIKFG